MPVQSLRYDGWRGLLAQPLRPGSGCREYPGVALTRLRLTTPAPILWLGLDQSVGLPVLRPRAEIADPGTRRRSTIAELDATLSALTESRGSRERLPAAAAPAGPST